MARHVTYREKPDKHAIEIIEEAFQWLKSFPLSLLVRYYLGTLPFCMGLMYFVTDMSRGAYSHEYCLVASLGMAVLFIWMKTMQSVFAIEAYAHIGQSVPGPWSVKSVARLFFCQTLLQASGWIILPIALLATIPFAWTYAVYQMVLVCDTRGRTDILKLAGHCFHISRVYTKMNHLILLILMVFGVFIFLNIAVIIYQIPHLIKMITSVESLLSMGGVNVFNTTFLMIAFCLTYLCVDPVVKTVFVLEKFYGDSIRSGTDLMARFRQITGRTASKSIAGGIVILIIVSMPLPAPGSPGPETRRGAIDPDILAQSIEQILQQREYAWRMPVQKDHTSGPGFMTSFFRWADPYVQKCTGMARSAMNYIRDFFKKLFPGITDSGDMKPENDKFGSPEWIFAGLIVLAGILVFFSRRFRQKKSVEAKDPAPKTIVVDLSDEQITPDALPYDQWMALAEKLMADGDFRSAVRALYLATLSGLAQARYLTIARYKSNREYEHELVRRAHTGDDLVQGFVRTSRFFDQVWYGLYPVEQKDVIQFARQQTRILEFVR